MKRFLLIVLLILFVPVAFGDSQNFNVGTGTDGGGGGAAWSSPNNITISGQRTSAVVAKSGGFSNNLFSTNFGFSIPSGATIQGVQVYFTKTSTGILSDTVDNGIFLLKAGVISGSDHSNNTYWSDGTAIYGGSSDLWGVTLLPADVNASNFGVSASATNQSTTTNHTAYVNAFVSMTVTYTGSGIGKRGAIQYSQTRTTGRHHGS